MVSHLDIRDSWKLSRCDNLREEWLPALKSAGNLTVGPLAVSPALLLLEGVDGLALRELAWP